MCHRWWEINKCMSAPSTNPLPHSQSPLFLQRRKAHTELACSNVRPALSLHHLETISPAEPEKAQNRSHIYNSDNHLNYTVEKVMSHCLFITSHKTLFSIHFYVLFLDLSCFAVDWSDHSEGLYGYFSDFMALNAVLCKIKATNVNLNPFEFIWFMRHNPNSLFFW